MDELWSKPGWNLSKTSHARKVESFFHLSFSPAIIFSDSLLDRGSTFFSSQFLLFCILLTSFFFHLHVSNYNRFQFQRKVRVWQTDREQACGFNLISHYEENLQPQGRFTCLTSNKFLKLRYNRSSSDRSFFLYCDLVLWITLDFEMWRQMNTSL